MFFHGISFRYLLRQFPFLNPASHVSKKKMSQLKDRLHLIQRFGFEPVHLLESKAGYTVSRCLEECFAFGDVVLAFPKLKEPFWQISCHEIGVPVLDMRTCCRIYLKRWDHIPKVRDLFPGKPLICMETGKHPQGKTESHVFTLSRTMNIM